MSCFHYFLNAPSYLHLVLEQFGHVVVRTATIDEFLCLCLHIRVCVDDAVQDRIVLDWHRIALAIGDCIVDAQCHLSIGTKKENDC